MIFCQARNFFPPLDIKMSFFFTSTEISVTKSGAPGPTATILSSGIQRGNFPLALFLFFLETLVPVVFPLPAFFVLEHSIEFCHK